MKRRDYLVAIVMCAALAKIGSASASTIESLVMPGPLVEGHAELESECSNCHEAFQRSNQRALCLDCHEDVATDIGIGHGFHGLFDDAADNSCSDCHTDHEGRNADIVQLDEATFDHGFTDFPLEGEHTNVACDGCHAADERHREAPGDCLSCHQDDNVHQDFMGTECGDCHSPSGWLDAEFDHSTTDFPLLGQHQELQCLDCHEDRTYQGNEGTCFGCHAEDDAHDGRSGQECDNCHNPNGWSDTSFDHDRDTRFPLQGSHFELTCGDCHSEDPFSDTNDPACVSCHLEDDNHDRHFGDRCDACHVSEEWTSVIFDHDVDTNHPLLGAHLDNDCTDCHVQPIFDVALGGECHDCHAENDPHQGEQGTACKDCHNEFAWPENVFFDHDLTRFPLLGNHTEIECGACHESHVFRDAPTDCVDCHLEEDPHDDRFSADCADCHNPVDWLAWNFDHDTRTDFPLDGAHLETQCYDCHRKPLTEMQELGDRCGDCHRSDDIHDGEFGLDCARCHSADSFHDVRAIQ